MASFSLPSLQIKTIGVFISFKISPTQGANLPSRPINNESLIWALVNSLEFLVSRITISGFFDNSFNYLVSISSMFLYPSWFNFTLAGKYAGGIGRFSVNSFTNSSLFKSPFKA